MKFSEEQFNEVIALPMGIGFYVYRSGKNEVSMLKAKRTEIEAYRKITLNETRKNNKATAQTNYEPLLKAGVIGFIGLLFLLSTVGAI